MSLNGFHHPASHSEAPHPFDPLSAREISLVVEVVRAEYGSVYYNAVTLAEPRKAEMQAWLAEPERIPRPARVADVVATGKGSKVYDALVDLGERRIVRWECVEGVQPIVCMRCLRFFLMVVWVEAECGERLRWRICRLSRL